MTQFNNEDLSKLMKIISTMDKNKLEQSISQVNNILSQEDKNKLFQMFNNGQNK